MRACLSSSGDDPLNDGLAYRTEAGHFDGTWQDRRQELVFIGIGLDVVAIERALDACLADDEEMRLYQAVWSVDEERLRDANGEATPFRFDHGDRVECATGEGVWESGTVLSTYYRQPLWPIDRWMPYEVELDDGDLIWAPADKDVCIRRARDAE